MLDPGRQVVSDWTGPASKESHINTLATPQAELSVQKDPLSRPDLISSGEAHSS